LRNHRLELLVALVATMAVGPARSQETAAGSADTDRHLLEEVITTARKIEERLVDVPLAITQYDAFEIERAGIRNLDDLAAHTPGLTFSNVFGDILPVPVIRNMAPTAIFQENNAGIFVDGVYVSGREGLNFSQLDIASIEVVKGPVSALYGRNTFSGAIIYNTARPTGEFAALAETQYGSNDKLLGKLMVSGPLAGDWLKGRAAVLYDNWDGSYPNQSGGKRIGGYEYTTFSGSLLFTPADSFEALLGLYASDDQIGPPAMSGVATNCENRNLVNPASFGLANFCGEVPAADDDTFSTTPRATGEDRDLVRAHLSLNWTLGGGARLSAISGYSSLQESYLLDAQLSGGASFAYQATPFAPMAPGPLRTFPTGLLLIGPGDETQEFSQELRFTSALDQPLRYSVGAYYYSTERDSSSDGVAATTPLPADFAGFCPCAQVAPGIGFSLGFGNAIYGPWFASPTGDTRFLFTSREETDAMAGFGWVELDFAERWSARAETRYTEEEKTVIDLLGSAPRSSDTWGFFTWRADVSFKPDEQRTWYAAIATGQKSGAFDTATVDFDGSGGAPAQLLVFSVDPEKNTTWEVGFKGLSADRRLQGDVAIFWIDWRDIVIPQVITEIDGQQANPPFSLDVNAGDATVYGIEAALAAQLTRGWRAQIGASWADAEYDDAQAETFVEFPSFAPDGDVSGRKVLRQSKWKGALALTYAEALNERFDWYMRHDLVHQDEQFADSTNQAVIPSHTYYNVRFGLNYRSWQLELWALNLFEDDSPSGAFREVFFDNTLPNAQFPVGATFPFRYSIVHPRLRQLGMTLRARF
jgi:iron complex outermembrane recepter protein